MTTVNTGVMGKALGNLLKKFVNLSVFRVYYKTCLSTSAQFINLYDIYDWITATAASRISKRMCAVIRIVNNVCLSDGPLFPSKVNNKCPAIMFAVRRTANVPGRIRLLIVSMITINGINMVGVP